LQRRCDLLEDDLKELIVVEAAPVPAEVPAADAGRKRAGAVPGAGQPAAGPPAEEDDPFAE